MTTELAADIDHLDRPAHPARDLAAHVRNSHGLDPDTYTDNLAEWHTRDHAERGDSQLTPAGLNDQELADANRDLLDPVPDAIRKPDDPHRDPVIVTVNDADRIPTDPAFRPRRKATPSADTPGPHRLGRTVWFRSRTGTYTMPAMITAVPESLYPPNVEAGHVPPLTADGNVHLAVFTCGRPGHVSAGTAEQHPELADPDRPNLPAGGTFAEWDIPEWIPEHPINLTEWSFDLQPAGTWTWPVTA